MGLINRVSKAVAETSSEVARSTKAVLVGNETDADLLLITFFLFAYLHDMIEIPSFGSTLLGKVGASLNHERHVPSYLDAVHKKYPQYNKHFFEIQTYCTCLELFVTKYNKDPQFIDFYTKKRYNTITDANRVKAKMDFQLATQAVKNDKFTLPFYKYDPSLESVAATIKVDVGGQSCTYSQTEISMFLL